MGAAPGAAEEVDLAPVVGHRHGRRHRGVGPGLRAARLHIVVTLVVPAGCARVSRMVQALPASATPAPTRNTVVMLPLCATQDRRRGPAPSPRSRAMLKVPAAAPREERVAVAKMAAKKAGVLRATPAPSRTAPVSSPIGVAQPRRTSRPTVIVSSAEAATGSAGSLSW